jgi:glycosyltransferase involved in cell wall biosynthesis
VLQPTRAIPRKNVPAGIAVAEQLGGTYWLTGPAEDGYADTLDGLLRAARCPVLRRVPPRLSMADAYAAADVVVFPSTWEGFGNPVLEAAVYRRPLVVGDYPVLAELRRFGFVWFSIRDIGPLRQFLARPDPALHDLNADIARTYFAPDALDNRLDLVLRDVLTGSHTGAHTGAVPGSLTGAGRIGARDGLGDRDSLGDLDDMDGQLGVADPV